MFDYDGLRTVTTVAMITDGLSNTMEFIESACVPNQTPPYNEFPSWNGGGSNICFAMAPPNWGGFTRQGAPTGSFLNLISYWCATSLHPGGLNTAFADGSVHFIKNSISSWPVNPHYGYPLSSYVTPSNGVYSLALTAAARLGTWQALSTISNGEVISSDSY